MRFNGIQVQQELEPISLRGNWAECFFGNASMDVSIERFRAETRPFADGWKSIDLRVIASRSVDKWIYGAMRIVLDSSDPSTATRQDLPSIEGLLVVHERWEIKRLDELLNSLSSGELHVRGETVIVENANTNPKMNYSFQRMTRQDSSLRLAVGSYSLYLESWAGIQMIDGNNEIIDSSLRSGTPPWDGVIDLITNFLNKSPKFVSSMSTKLVEIVAPVSVNITETSLNEENVVTVKVEVAPLIATDFVALSAIGHLEDGSQVRIRETKKTVLDKTHFNIGVTFPRKPFLVDVILTYHDLDVDRAKLFGKPRRGITPRLAVLQEEEKLENFLSSLTVEKDKFFEDKVSILFHILGLSPGHYGRVIQDNPDILVFPDSDDWVLEVECTEKEIDISNKLSKLATRTKILVAALPGVSVYPVVVTKFPGVMLNNTDKEKAAKEQISILTSDNFERLLQLALEGADPNKVRDFILGLIPFLNA
jgi:hypothetical protein